MRIKKRDVKTIKSTILSKISDAKIFLFGSRVDDTKRGGDIDLFVKTSINITLLDELSIITQLQLNGITRKIDLIIDTPQKSKQIFFESIKNEAIIL